MPSRSNVAIVDYGTGNLNSIKKVLDRLKVNSVVSSEPKTIAKADKIILPGVGHFAATMACLANSGLADTLNQEVIERNKVVLGICLGMELMAATSEEGNVKGLGWINADAVRLSVDDTIRYKVPHMGWNILRKHKDSPLLKGIDERHEFYFAHSYHLRLQDAADELSETVYESSFTSAIERGNIFGVQFHPEKSHDAGAQVLKSFVEL